MVDIDGLPFDVSGGVVGGKDEASIVKSTVYAMFLLLSVPVALLVIVEGVEVVDPFIPPVLMPFVFFGAVATVAYAGFRGFTRLQTWRRRGY